MILPDAEISPVLVADHYDELDPFYRALWGEHVHHGYFKTGTERPEQAVEALIDLVAERVGIPEGARLCDIGCGYGATAAHLAGSLGCRVTGITLSPVQAARAASRAAGEPRLTFRCGDWLANGLPDAAFDVAVAIESTEHMADKPRAFGEALRVLRPGGRFGICAWLAAEDPHPWQRRHLLEPICREGRLPGMGTETDYRDLLEATGFRDIEMLDISRAVRRTWTICARRLARALATRGTARRFLLDSRARNRIFAMTLPRLILAYRTGAMRYGIFTATRKD
jgi:tocopherol O-methyltransferase